ncbi:MAG: hypothetical protein ABJA34_02980 [Pseudonocardiales bacterium]
MPIPECALLSLADLRTYRRALEEEEAKVSYWRRLIQARADVTQAGSDLTVLDADALKHVLTGNHTLTSRTCLLSLSGSDEMPPLPDIAALWTLLSDPSDEAGRTRLVEDLRSLERQLSDYRCDLHERIAAATTEAIARYRADPLLCLSAVTSQQRPALSTP